LFRFASTFIPGDGPNEDRDVLRLSSGSSAATAAVAPRFLSEEDATLFMPFERPTFRRSQKKC
jgi:hypothetical protein